MILPRLLAIGSGKGGTGKTLVATALASALAERGERVLLCDADLGLSNSTVHLGLESGGDIAGFLADRTTLDQSVAPVFGGISERGGFDLMAAPPGSGALADIDFGVAERMTAKLRLASAYDRILLDLSAGVDAVTMGFAARADETLLVLTSDPAALTDAYAFVKLLLRRGARTGVRTPFALVNMADSETEARRTRDALAKTCNAFLKTAPDYLGFVPRDLQAQAAIRQQRSLVALYPDAPATRAIREVAKKLTGEPAQPPHWESGVPLR
ncbi:MAG TPA: AAA family ATPase [Rhizomicrobium sp.]|nr:AAA family ATPase [Rhizomicrobium sp.]